MLLPLLLSLVILLSSHVYSISMKRLIYEFNLLILLLYLKNLFSKVKIWILSLLLVLFF